ncbi:MAG: site-2 protease family protein [Chloroflexi bacterium]|nr:site-2 protease family protein [Chloroflexota bacterium]
MTYSTDGFPPFPPRPAYPADPAQEERAPVPQITQPANPRGRIGGRGIATTVGGLLLLLLSKLQFLLVLLKFSKFGVTTLSMLISLIFYGMFFGWSFAVGFILLLFVHEMGHVFVARAQGLRTTAPVFVPFFGALITMKEQPKGSMAEAALAAGGPVLGSVGALACVGLFGLTHQALFLALAYTGFFLNLFNLIPMSPLDGGRILGAVSRWAYVIGLPILLLVALSQFNPFLFLIVIMGAFDAWQRFRYPANSWYYAVSPQARWLVAGGYVALVLLLAFGMNETHSMLALVRAGHLG